MQPAQQQVRGLSRLSTPDTIRTRRASGTITDNFTTGAFAVACLDQHQLLETDNDYAPFALVGPIGGGDEVVALAVDFREEEWS